MQLWAKKYRTERRRYAWSRDTLCDHRRHGFQTEIKPLELEAYALTVDHCEICGEPLDWTPSSAIGPRTRSPTLDRVDNSDFLTFDNVMIVCHQCNRSKGDRSLVDFIDYCTLVAEKFKENTK